MAAQALPQGVVPPAFVRGLSFALYYGAARWLLRPELVNTHAIMYALVAEAPGSNTLELFHPLWVPVLKLLAAARAALGFSGNSLMLFQLFCLLGAALHVFLVHRLALKVLKSETLAFAAAWLSTASINLWAWSTQTMPYTWATALLLAAFCELVGRRRPLLLGLLTGLSAGLDTAALALVPACLVELRKPRLLAAYAAAAAAALALCYAPYLAIGRELPGGFGDMLANLPPDIHTLYATKSVAAQFRAFLASTAPKDIPWLALATLWYYAWTHRRAEDAPLIRSSLLFGGGILFFFLVNDPHNRFVYSAAVTAPVLAAWALRRVKKPELALLGLWAAVVLRNFAFPADYLPPANPGFSEARFVRTALGKADLLVSFSSPDWLFNYALEGAVPLAVSGPGTAARARETLCAGGTVWLASDSLFRDGTVGPADEKRLLASFKGILRLGEAVVSPGGQHYYPLSPARPCRP